METRTILDVHYVHDATTGDYLYTRELVIDRITGQVACNCPEHTWDDGCKHVKEHGREMVRAMLTNPTEKTRQLFSAFGVGLPMPD